ncbi:hypothetical protein HUU61_19735 [Rhodopseudomonas palustris]|nr:hypothetical protein [Rhodopseudomonas palustris]
MSYIDMLDVSVRDASFVSRDRMVKNARSLIQNTLVMVEANDELRNTAVQTLDAVSTFSQLLTMTAAQQDVEAQRKLTREQIDVLRKAIANAPRAALAEILRL